MEKLRISENRRYFVTSDGKPFSWLADTDWTLPQRLKWDDAEYLMKKRKSQGFTVLQMVVLDPESDPEIRNPVGDKALIGDDPLKPNEAYFSYLDRILSMAEQYGFYVLLLPAWGQLIVGHNWVGEFFEKTITEENAFAYGKFLGERYKDRNNILWCLGGDRQPIHLGIDYRDVWRRLAEGIAKGVTGEDLRYNEKNPLWEELLMTYHACHEAETGECSTMSYWTDEEAWISFIMLQSGHGLKPKNYELVQKEYDRKIPMPVWDGEPAYEMMPTSWPVIDSFHGSWMVRRRAYWSLFAGAFGYTYGHCSVWCSISEKERNNMNRYTWCEALDSEGSGQMKHLREFMDAAQVMTCLPRQDLLLPDRRRKEQKAGASEDELNCHIQVCLGRDADMLLAYLPSGGEIHLLTDWSGPDAQTALPAGDGALLRLPEEMRRPVSVSWYDTREGNTIRCQDMDQPGAADRVITVKSPTAGEEQDWILIVTGADRSFAVEQKEYYHLEGSAEGKKVFEW